MEFLNNWAPRTAAGESHSWCRLEGAECAERLGGQGNRALRGFAWPKTSSSGTTAGDCPFACEDDCCRRERPCSRLLLSYSFTNQAARRIIREASRRRI